MSTAGNADAEVVIVGAGAAGLATAVFAARAHPGLRVRCLEGARTIGAKILVSGGSRCNVTNRTVTERDFWGGSARAVKAVLAAFPASHAAGFFEEIGVALHEEQDGKLFPDAGRSRVVLDALLGECARLGVAIAIGQRVEDVRRAPHGFDVVTASSVVRAPRVVLATGGCSLPKSGSDGFGFQLARRLGHRIVPPVPALVPLELGPGVHTALAGVSHAAVITVRGREPVTRSRDVRVHGSLLWTHLGASGPVVLDASRHWHRAQQEGRPVELVMNLVPGDTTDSVEQRLAVAAREQPTGTVAGFLRPLLPAAVAQAWVDAVGLLPALQLGQVTRAARRALAVALTSTPLDVRGSRGFGYAEATAGGVCLDEVDTATMASRLCDGLYVVGEMLDVDGRLGGFNFQWAWSSGWVAGRALARRAATSGTAGAAGAC